MKTEQRSLISRSGTPILQRPAFGFSCHWTSASAEATQVLAATMDGKPMVGRDKTLRRGALEIASSTPGSPQFLNLQPSQLDRRGVPPGPLRSTAVLPPILNRMPIHRPWFSRFLRDPIVQVTLGDAKVVSARSSLWAHISYS